MIAIDGPAGAGKSATARELAVRLGLPYLDTGAMYRAVALLARRAGLGPDLDAEGRDIGTVVFPDATLKVFLTAEPEVRARRRFDELTRRGVAASWEDVLAEQRERDRRDSTRPDSPLRPAEGAAIVDTSRLTLPEVVEAVVALLPRSGNPLTR